MSNSKQMPIGKQVLVAYGALCLVLAMIGALFIFSLRAIEYRRQTLQAAVHHKWEVINDVAKNVGLMQAEVLQHVMVIDAAEMGMAGAGLSELLFDKAQIAATPMDGWGAKNGGQFLRLVFANEPIARLKGIGARMRRALAAQPRRPVAPMA